MDKCCVCGKEEELNGGFYLLNNDIYYFCKDHKTIGENFNNKPKSQIVEISLDAIYFDEIIKAFLERYNTVSIQKSTDCYFIKVEKTI